MHRLFQENFFTPLGLEDTHIHGSLGGSGSSSARDLGRIAQMALNRGSYGDRTFFSEEVYEQLLPRLLPVDQSVFPTVMKWGIGLVFWSEPDLRPGRTGETIFGKNAFGHGAASGTVFIIDPDNDLIVVAPRDQLGVNYGLHMTQLLLAIKDGMLTD